ncbi:MAG: PorP/SprF family type IX secretion system membrane protein [Cyclobacteriaceae bacterium]
MKKLVTYIVCFWGSVFLVKSQDTQFSQYFSASLFLNPAFAGVYNDPSLHMNHRRQVQSADVVNELTQVSFIFPIKPAGRLERSVGGVGIMAYNERSGIAGVFQNSAAFLTYAHNFKFGLLSSDILSVGLQAGYETRSLNFSDLTWGSQYNPFYGFDDTLPIPVTEFDNQTGALIINAGIMYYYNPTRNYMLYQYSAFSGFSATNVNGPNKSFNVESKSREPMLIKYNGGVEIKYNKLYTTPSLLFLYLRGNFQFNAGLNFAYAPNADRYRAKGNQLLFGAWYRLRDSFIFMGGIKFSSMAIRASYDLNTNLFVSDRNVAIAQNAFELSIQYHISKNAGYRRMSNPLF